MNDRQNCAHLFSSEDNFTLHMKLVSMCMYTFNHFTAQECSCTDEKHVHGWNTRGWMKYLCIAEIPVHGGIPVHGWNTCAWGNTCAWLKYTCMAEIPVIGWSTRPWLKYTCMSEIHVHGGNVLFTSTLLPWTTLRALLNYLWSFYVDKTINTKFLFNMFFNSFT